MRRATDGAKAAAAPATVRRRGSSEVFCNATDRITRAGRRDDQDRQARRPACNADRAFGLLAAGPCAVNRSAGTRCRSQVRTRRPASAVAIQPWTACRLACVVVMLALCRTMPVRGSHGMRRRASHGHCTPAPASQRHGSLRPAVARRCGLSGRTRRSARCSGNGDARACHRHRVAGTAGRRGSGGRCHGHRSGRDCA